MPKGLTLEDYINPSVPAPPEELDWRGQFRTPGPGGSTITYSDIPDAQTSSLSHEVAAGSDVSPAVIMHELGHVDQLKSGDETLGSALGNIGGAWARGAGAYDPKYGARHEVGSEREGQPNAPSRGLEFLRQAIDEDDPTAKAFMRSYPWLDTMNTGTPAAEGSSTRTLLRTLGLPTNRPGNTTRISQSSPPRG